MRVISNESAVIASMSSRDFVQCLYDCGMLSRKGEDLLPCSPDGVALIDFHAPGMPGEVSEGPQIIKHQWKTRLVSLKSV